MKGQLLKLLVVMTICLLLAAGCAAPAPTPPTAMPIPPTPVPPTVTAAPPTFPYGAFDVKPYLGDFLGEKQIKKLTYAFTGDGTFTVTGQGFTWCSGRAIVTGNRITMQCSFLGQTCSEEATYNWASDGGQLALTLVADPCEDRRMGLAGGLTKRTQAEVAQSTPATVAKLRNLGTTKSLSILPLVDTKGEAPFKPEFGVSYLIKTDDATILMDLGANRKSEDPSPLMVNMQQASVKWSDLTAIVISHAHFDHTGGIKWQAAGSFAPGNQQIDLGSQRVYVPTALTYPGLTPTVVTQPVAIAKGVASIGTLPMTAPGFGPEQILAVNVEGKGIVLITGCGHPTVPKIVERAKMVFDEPIVGLIGGLHYSETDAKVMEPRITYLKDLNLQVIAVSPHDSSAAALMAIHDAFPDMNKDIVVGQQIAFGTASQKSAAAAPTALEIAQKFQAADARNDVDALMALFADGFTYSWGSDAPLSNMIDVRNWFEYAAGLNARTLNNQCRADAGGATCEFRRVNECTGAGGPGGFEMELVSTFLIKDGKVQSLVTSFKRGYGYSQEGAPRASWMQANYPADAASVRPGNFSRALGERIGKLCREFYAQKAAGSLTPTSAPPSNLVGLAKSYYDAFNRRDLDGALALVVDEGLSYLSGSVAYRDKQTLRSHLEENVGTGVTYELTDCTLQGEALRCTLLSRSEYCSKASCGLDVYHRELTLKPKDGKIQLLSLQMGTISAGDQKACGEAYPKYAAWAEANRPEDWKKVSQPVLYDLRGRALGELQSQVCKAYLEATKK